MRWQGERESENVEDIRGGGVGPMVIGGGLGTIVILLLASFIGFDPRPLLRMQQQNAPAQARPGQNAPVDPEQEQLAKFVKVVLGETEDVWQEVFREQVGKPYRDPKLVLFTGQVNSACGLTSAAVGPFYCPGDEKVYIDLAFYDELKRRFKAPGEFAQAYVIAHEVGHHVQNLLGISRQVDALRRRLSERDMNAVSVRMELQADFLAGVWAHHTQRMKSILEPGDIESGLRAATAIGDDRIQMQAQGYVVPDSFTHGTSEQRVRWFTKGLQTGDIRQGDTFNADRL
jgi:predicted metalloprotease